MQFHPSGLLEGLSTLQNYESRSICAENRIGEKGKGGMAKEGTGASCARDLGQGWKVSPSLVVFHKDIRVTIQALGWREGGRYLPLQDDIASVAFFYLDRPASFVPDLPDRDGLEII